MLVFDTGSELFALEVGGLRFGLPLAVVREVLRAVEISPLPGAPRGVAGVVNLRGQLTPVYDLRARLGLRLRPVDPNDQLILAHAGPSPVLLQADQGHGLLRLNDRIDSPEGIGLALDGIAGLAKLPDGLLLIHDLAAFLSPSENDALDRALADLC